jgi:uncharacterized RDD family membrane protein YckC
MLLYRISKAGSIIEVSILMEENMEGNQTQIQTAYAGFWRRGLALAIDGVVLLLPVYLVGHTLSRAWMSTYGDRYAAANGMEALQLAAGVGLVWLYSALFESSEWSATPGKRVLGLRVRKASGAQLGFWRAGARSAGKIISAVVFGLGFLVAVLNRRRQALHDFMAGTVVEKLARG